MSPESIVLQGFSYAFVIWLSSFITCFFCYYLYLSCTSKGLTGKICTSAPF